MTHFVSNSNGVTIGTPTNVNVFTFSANCVNTSCSTACKKTIIPAFFFHWTLKSVPEAELERSQTCKMALFAKVVNGFHQLNIFTKSPILDAWLSSEYTSK